MAYKVILAKDVQGTINLFAAALRRAWDLRIAELIDDPFPREGADFAIVVTTNLWHDKFLTYVIDEFPVIAQFDIHPWPATEENPQHFEGKVSVWKVIETD